MDDLWSDFDKLFVPLIFGTNYNRHFLCAVHVHLFNKWSALSFFDSFLYHSLAVFIHSFIRLLKSYCARHSTKVKQSEPEHLIIYSLCSSVLFCFSCYHIFCMHLCVVSFWRSRLMLFSSLTYPTVLGTLPSIWKDLRQYFLNEDILCLLGVPRLSAGVHYMSSMNKYSPELSVWLGSVCQGARTKKHCGSPASKSL